MEIPECEIYEDGRERRVLSEERYELSRRFLPGLIKGLSGVGQVHGSEDFALFGHSI
jgi:hypothetical protein